MVVVESADGRTDRWTDGRYQAQYRHASLSYAVDTYQTLGGLSSSGHIGVVAIGDKLE